MSDTGTALRSARGVVQGQLAQLRRGLRGLRAMPAGSVAGMRLLCDFHFVDSTSGSVDGISSRDSFGVYIVVDALDDGHHDLSDQSPTSVPG